MNKNIKKAYLVYFFKKYGGLNKKALDRNPEPSLSLNSPGFWATHNPIGVPISSSAAPEKTDKQISANPGLDAAGKFAVNTFSDAIPILGRNLDYSALSPRHQKKVNRFNAITTFAPIAYAAGEQKSIPYTEIALAGMTGNPNKKIQYAGLTLGALKNAIQGAQSYYKNQPDSPSNTMPEQQFHTPFPPNFKETNLNLPSQQFHTPFPQNFKETNLNLPSQQPYNY